MRKLVGNPFCQFTLFGSDEGENVAFTQAFPSAMFSGGDANALLHAGLIGGLLSHIGCTAEQLLLPAWREMYRQVLAKHFRSASIYRKLTLRIAGCERSLLLRAHPSIEGSPWYDFIKVLVQETDDDGQDVSRFHVARCMGFVHLRPRRSGTQASEQHFVLVQWFVSALTGARGLRRGAILDEDGADAALRAKHRPYISDLRARHDDLPFSYVHSDPNLAARYGIVDTEAISGALWVSEDPGWPGKFWVITNDFCE